MANENIGKWSCTLNSEILSMFKYFTSLFSSKRQNEVSQNRNGKWKEFSKEGILISEGNYVDDLRSGKWRFYYETGELAIEEIYHAGRIEGAFKSYYKNGQVISIGQYVNNKCEGEFRIFNESGFVIKIMKFKGDILIEEIEGVILLSKL